ncbi:MAG: hypothetical protein JXR77_08625 [Lentisphaeria bacterium]|nr:hypothetical protein [Lentisphaeria bacterium]
MKILAEDEAQYVVCLDNSGYLASLEKHKIYRALPDKGADADGDLRIVDESGEDYLYPKERFVPISVPPRVQRSLALTG